MAHFYGLIQGSRGQVTRLGTKKSGLGLIAASWEGAIRVTLFEQDGTDHARIECIPWEGAGTKRTLYSGPVSGKNKNGEYHVTVGKPGSWCGVPGCSCGGDPARRAA